MHHILTVNAGSSSLRFALFAMGSKPERLLTGKMERLGTGHARFEAGRQGMDLEPVAFDGSAPGAGPKALATWLRNQTGMPVPNAVGHRVVHGMQRDAPEKVTLTLLKELRQMSAFDPEHLPREIEFIEDLQREYPALSHVACFDTAFHRTMPPVAKLLPIPRRYTVDGVQRYGFHGLSYTYLIQHLTQLGGGAARGRVVLAHLGGGASMAAVRDGQSIDTSMGFTPTSGLMMGTRTGDLDPGLMSFLAQKHAMTPTQLQTMVNHESGLLGVSETSADVRDLLERESEDFRAREALALFCYQAKRWLGSLSAVLGGLDTLVFSGGIGENCAIVRARVCEDLEYLGIDIDPSLNERHAPVISSASAKVTVRVINTDEELVIAESTAQLLKLSDFQSENRYAI